MKLSKIQEVGSSRMATLKSDYDTICKKVFKDNVTKLDDPYKVKASWGIEDLETKRKAFIWCYKYRNKRDCQAWSLSGDISLIEDIFGKENVE